MESQPKQPSVSELLDCIRDNARNLSDAIKAANERGISVHIAKSPEGSEHVFDIIYPF